METARHLNIFPAKGGISSYYSPNILLGGQPLDYTKHCVVSFGAYVQANHETQQTNSNAPRTLDGIYLRPVLSIQGGHEIMDLHSGETITRARVTEIPVTPVVIKAVEDMAYRQGFKSLKFKNRNKVILFDTDWIAGVDYQHENENEDENENNENDFDEVNDDDYEYEPQNDEELDEDFEDIDKEELAETLTERNDEREDNPINVNNEINNDQDDVDYIVSEDEEPEDNREEDCETSTESAPTRRSGREVKPVDRYGFNQVEKTGKAVRFNDGIRELEYCHNLIAQVHPNPDMDMEYDTYEATVIARTMNDLNQKVTMQGACFVQQYNLKKG